MKYSGRIYLYFIDPLGQKSVNRRQSDTRRTDSSKWSFRCLDQDPAFLHLSFGKVSRELAGLDHVMSARTEGHFLAHNHFHHHLSGIEMVSQEAFSVSSLRLHAPLLSLLTIIRNRTGMRATSLMGMKGNKSCFCPLGCCHLTSVIIFCQQGQQRTTLGKHLKTKLSVFLTLFKRPLTPPPRF